MSLKTKKDESVGFNKSRKDGKIFGIGISSTSMNSLLDEILFSLKNKRKNHIVTANPEILLHASQNQRYKNILKNADFVIPDGVGIVLAAKFLNAKSLKRIRGRDLFENLLAASDENNLKIFLLGAKKEVNQKAIQKIKKTYPSLQVEGDPGPLLDTNAEPVSEVDRKSQSFILNSINKFKPDILFVAFGAPKQEYWIAKHLPEVEAKVAVGIGGTLDTFTEILSPPPKLLADIGLEWAWRLFLEPKRAVRIVNALFLFPLAVAAEKLKNTK